jgi:hypothetical protein
MNMKLNEHLGTVHVDSVPLECFSVVKFTRILCSAGNWLLVHTPAIIIHTSHLS